MQAVRAFYELEVYKSSRGLARSIFLATRAFPPEEKFALTDQIRRSSGSVGAQIAEAWAKRRYPKHFIAKLTDADGEQLETLHWLNVIEDRSYLAAADLSELRSACRQIGRMLGSMIQKAESFAQG